MSRNSLISIIIISILGLIVLFGLPGLNREHFQFPRNFVINNNSQNWANHEYGYNLMMSAEPNSIFMTEGGDNQVFSLLYFATTERMRPDIDFFDQKGNVFPRLYGDLLNTPQNELNLVRAIRDFQLFSTGRPVYLTWERPNLEKLNINYLRFLKAELLKNYPPNIHAIINSKYRFNTLDEFKRTARTMVPNSVYDLTLRSGGNLANQDFRYLGPWYLKNFGLVFRVTPLRYAIVDALEASNGKANFATIVNEVKNISKIAIIKNQYEFYVNQLTTEGYVKRDENQIILVKPYRASFDYLSPVDYWDHYIYSYTNVESAPHWDFLTREIFGNYTRVYNVSSQRRTTTLQKSLSYVTNPATQITINNELNKIRQRKNFFQNTIFKFNYDNPGMVYEYGRYLHNIGKTEEATKAFVMTARANYRFNENYLRAASMLLDLIKNKPEKKDALILAAQEYIGEFYLQFEKFYVMTGQTEEIEQLQRIQNAKRLEQRIKNINSVSQDEIKTLESTAGNDIGKLDQLAKLYQKQGSYLEAIKVMQKIIDLEPTNFNHSMALVEYTKQNRIDIALSTVDSLIANYEQLNEGKPSMPELQYVRGELLFTIANVQKSQNQEPKTVANLFSMSQSALNVFLATYRNQGKDDSTLLHKINRAEAMLGKINEEIRN